MSENKLASSDTINRDAFESFVRSELGDVPVMDQGRYISAKINNYWRTWQAAQSSRSPASISHLLPAFSGVPLSKLNALLDQGYQISGVSFERADSSSPVKRGAVTAGGMVLWWDHETHAAIAKMQALMLEASIALRELNQPLSETLKVSALPWDQRQSISDRVCHWKEEDSKEMPGTWHTSCGELFTLTDGTPSENRMLYCYHCGGLLKDGK